MSTTEKNIAKKPTAAKAASSTKRKPGTKAVNKKTGKEVAFMTDVEMIRFELLSEKQRSIKAEIAIKELTIKNYQLESEINRLKSIVEGSAAAELQTKLSASRQLSLEYRDEIKKKYDIKSDKFGYNPDTGQLIEE